MNAVEQIFCSCILSIIRLSNTAYIIEYTIISNPYIIPAIVYTTTFIVNPSLPTDKLLFFFASTNPIMSDPPVDAPLLRVSPTPIPPSIPPTKTFVKTLLCINK